jgi:hypothetical protein
MFIYDNGVLGTIYLWNLDWVGKTRYSHFVLYGTGFESVRERARAYQNLREVWRPWRLEGRGRD